MAATDETALVCDSAERYRVLEWRALPLKTAAALAAGLPSDARIMRKLSGMPAAVNTLLLGLIADALHMLVWQNTKDGAEGQNRPRSVLAALLGQEEENDCDGFEDAEAFERWRESMTESAP